MITENLTEFMNKVKFDTKVCFYEDEEKGLMYPLTPSHILPRIDYLELTKEELEKYKFEQKIDKKKYKMYDCTKVVPKNTITKRKEDMYTLVDSKVKATHIWNVSNQIGIHETFEDKEEAIKLYNDIKSKVMNVIKD